MATENQFFSALARLSSNPRDQPLQNVSKKDSDKIYKKYYEDVGWVAREKIKEERRDYYYGLIEKGEVGELRRIKGIRHYWMKVRSFRSKYKLTTPKAREMWKARVTQKKQWVKQP